jgi:hypothetical protein
MIAKVSLGPYKIGGLYWNSSKKERKRVVPTLFWPRKYLGKPYYEEQEEDHLGPKTEISVSFSSENINSEFHAVVVLVLFNE